MSWYYARRGQRIGPVEEEEFSTLVRDGVVMANTLVWQRGMQDWQPYAQVGHVVSAEQPTDIDPSAYDRPTPPTEEANALPPGSCCHCGRRFSSTAMIAYRNVWVCGNCKQSFFQRLQEGLTPPSQFIFAGFWIRFLAKFIDAIISILVIVPIVMIILASMNSTLGNYVILYRVANIFAVLFGLTYTTFFLGRFGATPGKMACGLKVVRSDGEKVTYLRAFGRHFAEMISGIIFYIGYIMAAFNAEKESLHDIICDTRVIYK